MFNHPRSFWDDSYGISMSAHPAGKVVVFGFPKSGNVWLKSMLVDCLGLDPVEPLLDVGKPGVGITHRPFDSTIGNRPDFLHGVCIVRDPRDVVASYFRYSQTARFRSARPEFHHDDAEPFYFEWFLSRAAPAHRLLTHSERYARLGVPVVRYERLRRDPGDELRRLCLRWGVEVDGGAIGRAVDRNRIETLRRDGKVLEKVITADHFAGGGQIGGYADILPGNVVRDIESRFGRVLRRWGYLAD